MGETQDSIETWLVTQVADLLGLDRAKVDPNTRFRDYGVDSPIAIKLVERLRAHLGYHVPVTLPWRSPTISRMAHSLSSEKETLQHPLADEGRETLEPIAVVGMACNLPGGADNLDKFMEVLVNGVDTTSNVPVDRWEVDSWYHEDRSHPGKMNTRRGAFLDNVDQFDPGFWGISPREAVAMDPQQRLFMKLAWEALEHTGIDPEGLKNSSKGGVFVGAMWRDYATLSGDNPDPIAQHTLAGQDISIIPARVSYALGLRGPCLTVNTACSSSLVAVHLACGCLRRGEATVALAGGISLMLSPHSGVALSKFGGLSPDGRCKAFDASANGYGRGEGGGIVVLKTRSKALLDGDHIYCLIRGSAINNDGASNGLTAPCPDAQTEVLTAAWSHSGVNPCDAAYVEAHGTGTSLGDPIEAEALGGFFGPGREEDKPLRIGSVKTNIGHLEAASGIAGLIKVALCLDKNFIPPSLHFNEPNPHIDFEKLKLQVQTTTEPWPEGSRLAAVSSFGFGGTNCHLVLDGAPGSDQEFKPNLDKVLSPLSEPKIVFVYSGYGSQWIGMGQQLIYQEPFFRDAILSCDEHFKPLTGFSIMEELCAPADRSRMTDTATGQILLFSFQYALGELLDTWGIRPDVVVGQSMGEILAALRAGILTLADAARVMVGFTRLARAADGRGGMAVVGLEAEKVEPVIKDAGGALAIAGYVAPANTVISGNLGPLEDAVAQWHAAGLDAMRINVGYACHCHHMEPYLEKMSADLSSIQPARGRIPIISTVTGQWLEGPECDGRHWANNNKQPVRLLQSIKKILEKGSAILVEISPHPVLRKPLGQIISEVGADAAALGSCWREENERDSLKMLVAKIVSRGRPLDLNIEMGRPIKAGCIEFKRPYIIPISARHPQSLTDRARDLWHYIKDHQQHIGLPDLAYSLATSRAHFPVRRALITHSLEGLSESLANSAEGVFSHDMPESSGKIAFLFTGQGSQYVGMGKELYDCQYIFREALDQCAGILDQYLEKPLLEVLFSETESPDAAIHQTLYTQPALFALEYATFRLWRSWGIYCDAVLGHSVGEIAAAAAVGVFSLEEGCRLIAARARLMNQLPAGGAMLAVSADEAVLRPYLQETTLDVAAFNGPQSIVVSGDGGEIEALAKALADAGIKTRRIQVSHAFHSSHMDPILPSFREVASTISHADPLAPYLSNVTGTWADSSVIGPDYWVEHLRRPVCFYQGIQTLIAEGYTTFLEIGPQPVLLGLLRASTDEKTAITSLPSMRKANGKHTIWNSLATLYAMGYKVDWKNLYYHLPVLRLTLPTYPFHETSFWIPKSSKPALVPEIKAKVIHPLVHQRLRLATHPKETIFASSLHRNSYPFLRDYRVDDVTVFPNVFWCEMVHAAGLQLCKGVPLVMTDISFETRLFLPEQAHVEVQMVFTPSEASWRFGIHCLWAEDGDFVRHASGTLMGGEVLPKGDVVDLEALAATFDREENGRFYYQEIMEKNIDIGPALHSLTRRWLKPGESLAVLDLGPPNDPAGFNMHPALLEDAVGGAVGCLPHGEGYGHYFPAKVGRAAFYEDFPQRVWCHGVKTSADECRVDLKIFDDHGRLLARLDGLEYVWENLRATPAGARELLYETVWVNKERSSHETTALEGTWLVIDGPGNEGQNLCRELEKQGEHVYLAKAGAAFHRDSKHIIHFDPTEPEQYHQVLQALADEAATLRAVVYLAGLEAGLEDLASHRFEHIHRLGCLGLLALFKALMHHAPVFPTLFVVTRGAQALGEPRAMPGVAQWPLWNLGRVIAAEHPEFACRCIDLDPAGPIIKMAAFADKLRHLVTRETRETMIAVRDDKLFIPRLKSMNTPLTGEMEINGQSTYLITGGLGGLGLSFAHFLVEKGARHLILTSRRGPNENHDGFLQTLKALGATVTAAAVDVTHASQMKELINSIKGPPLRGVVHAAGIVQDALLSNCDETQFLEVLAPKVDGAWYLHEATRNMDLDFFILFSSVASLFAAVGQGAYSAGNGFLDGLAHYRNSLGLPATSINWGVFQNVGMTTHGGAEVWEARGLGAVAAEKCWQILNKLPKTAAAQPAVVKLLASAFDQTWTDDPFFEDIRPEQAEKEVVKPIELIKGALTAKEKRRGLANFLREQAGRVLGFPPNEPIPKKEGFTDLGMDSLMAVEFRNLMQHGLAASLPTTLIFDYPNLDNLESFLYDHLFPPEKAETLEPEPEEADNLDDLLEALDASIDDSSDGFESLIDAELAELKELGIEI